MHKYRLISKKGEGTFSEVLKAQSIKTGKYVAIKCMKNHFDSIDQVNNLREIQALRRLSPNPGVIKLYEVLYDQPTGRLALVFELMSMNIYELIRGKKYYLPEAKIKAYMYQLVKSMDHMHRNGIFHRDIKPENVLISDDVLKVADFGSCRGIYSKQPYTEYISTRWYRAPECLLTDGYYGYKMDMWGVGCVMFEIIALFPLFPGTNEMDQIERIHNIMGTPPVEILNKFKQYATHIEFNFIQKKGTGIAKLIPHASEDCIDIIKKLLAYDPEDRLSARQALRHPYFGELRQRDKRAEKLAKNSLKESKSSSSKKSSKHGGSSSRSQQQLAHTDNQKVRQGASKSEVVLKDAKLEQMSKELMYSKHSKAGEKQDKDKSNQSSKSSNNYEHNHHHASKRNRAGQKIKSKNAKSYYEGESSLPGLSSKTSQHGQSSAYEKSNVSMLPSISPKKVAEKKMHGSLPQVGSYGVNSHYKTSYSSKNYGHYTTKSKVYGKHDHLSHGSKQKRYYSKSHYSSNHGNNRGHGKSKPKSHMQNSHHDHLYPSSKVKSNLQPITYRSKNSHGRSSSKYVSPYSQKYIANQRLIDQ